MTTSQSRTLRKAGAVALSLALAMSTLAITPASAAKKVKLAKTKITVNVGKTKKVKIKNVNKKQVKKLTVKSSKKAVATAKKAGKVAIKVTGKKKGSAKVTANLKLKTKVAGKKAYKLTLKVTVKKAATTPTPTVAPTAAPTPVVSGASISLDKPAGYTCQVKGPDVTITANILPATSNENVDWSVADPTIASVSGAGATVNGVATATLKGLKEGKTTVTAKIGAASASAIVTVEKEQIVAKITNVKQTKANAIEVFFDIDWKTDNQGFDKGKFDVDIYNAAGQITKTVPVNKLVASTATSASGSSAVLTLDSPFADKDKVSVNLYKGKDYTSKFDFVASVGAPADVNLTKIQYQDGVEEKVDFALVDANGVDVTSTVDVDSRVQIVAEGEGVASSNLSPASSAKLTMAGVGKTATVTISYTSASNTTGKPDFSKPTLVSCIAPVPVVGAAHFKKTSTDGVKKWTDDDTGVAKFYKGSDLTAVDAEVNKDTVISFYASDEDGNAISYDEYSVTSSNGDVASATCEGAGKYVNITITGVKEGSCNINVAAKKNTKDAPYIIPVTVKKAGTFTSFAIKANRSTVSNAHDSVYQGANKIEITAKDSNGNDISKSADLSVTFELTKPETVEGWSATDTAGKKAVMDGKFEVVGHDETDGKTADYATYDATGAKGTSYTVTATASFGDVTKTATTTITVKPVPATAFTRTDTDFGAAAATYDIEFDNNRDYTDNKAGTARLAAKIGGVFAGYVDENGDIGDSFNWNGSSDSTLIDLEQATANKASSIVNVRTGMQAGSKWNTVGTVNAGKVSFNLYNRKDNFTEGKFTTGAEATVVNYSTVGGDAKTYYADGSLDTNFAKAGTYKISYKWATYNKTKGDWSGNGGKDVTLTVKDNMFVPTVTVENRTLSDYSDTGVVEALKCNVDLNSNTSNNASITKVVKDNKDTAVDYSGASTLVKYAVVSEDDYIIYVPITASFNQKS